MSSPTLLTQVRQHFTAGACVLGLFANMAPPAAAAQKNPPSPVTPIQHVIVIIGENRSFDHVYGNYVPKSGQTVSNLLSKGIVSSSGYGPNYYLSAQSSPAELTIFQNRTLSQ